MYLLNLPSERHRENVRDTDTMRDKSEKDRESERQRERETEIESATETETEVVTLSFLDSMGLLGRIHRPKKLSGVCARVCVCVCV